MGILGDPSHEGQGVHINRGPMSSVEQSLASDGGQRSVEWSRGVRKNLQLHAVPFRDSADDTVRGTTEVELVGTMHFDAATYRPRVGLASMNIAVLDDHASHPSSWRQTASQTVLQFLVGELPKIALGGTLDGRHLGIESLDDCDASVFPPTTPTAHLGNQLIGSL